MQQENLHFETVNLTPELHKFLTTSFNECYRVDWTKVIPLIMQYKVHLSGGFAFVSKEDAVDLIVDEYKRELSKHLAKGARHWANGGMDYENFFGFYKIAEPILIKNLHFFGLLIYERLVPLLKFFSPQNTQDYSTSCADGTLTSANIDQVAEQSYPLCMLKIHRHLRKTHHLKHFARLYYWRFVRQAGLPLEECLKIFQQECSKYADGAKQFDKEFRYNIRHTYGQEGKRATYTGYGCMSIIQSNTPAHGDCHGCPYKHSNKDEVFEMLEIELKKIKPPTFFFVEY